MKNSKTLGNKYVMGAYRRLKQEIANVSAFEIDERYFRLRRDIQICEEYLRETEPKLAKYI